MAVDPFAFGVTRSLAIVVVASAAFAVLARRLNLPTVVGYLGAGILIGPVAGLIQIGPALSALGEFGIALLLFLVGLDLSFDEARAVGPPAALAATAQLAASAAGGFVLARLIGFDHGTSLLVAAALAFSSTVVVVKMLVDLRNLTRTYGRLSVGILLVQDVYVVLLLTLLPVLGAGGAASDAGGLAYNVASALARTALIVLVALVAATRALPSILRRVSSSPSVVLFLGLMWLFLAVAASAALSVSVEVGAFAAGLGLAQTEYARELKRGVNPLLNIFIALFFVTLGAGFDLRGVIGILPGAAAFSVFVLVGKAVVLTLILGLLRYPLEASFRAGATLGQVSEFSIVLAALAVREGLVDADVRDFVVLVAVITIAASSVIAWRSGTVHERLARFRWFRALPHGSRGTATLEERPTDHVLLLGWDEVGRDLASVLLARGERVVVVSPHLDVPEALPEGVEGYYASPSDWDTLEAAGVREARFIVANLAEPGLVRILLHRNGDLPPVVARAETEGVARILEAEGAAGTFAPREATAARALDFVERAEGARHG